MVILLKEREEERERTLHQPYPVYLKELRYA
jgi:hypothetical protein